MNYLTKFIGSIAIIIIFFTNSSQATLVLPVNIEQMAHLSEHIFIGTCVGKQTEWDAEESGQLVTWYTFRVEKDDWIKGESWTGGEIVVWKQLAQGTFNMDGKVLRQNLYGPDFEVGKEYWVALPRPSSVGLLFPLGMNQGVMAVQKDENGVRRLPELKSRLKFLKHGLNKKKDQKTLFLKSQVNTISQDDSVDNFKTIIQSALDQSTASDQP